MYPMEQERRIGVIVAEMFFENILDSPIEFRRYAFLVNAHPLDTPKIHTRKQITPRKILTFFVVAEKFFRRKIFVKITCKFNVSVNELCDAFGRNCLI